MEKEMKDPRTILVFWLRMSIITLILSPFFYFNLKRGDITQIILFFIIGAIIFFITKRFDKKDEEYKLKEIGGVGHMFAVLWAFFALAFIFVISSDYFKSSIVPSTTSLLIISVLLFFSIILFYFSYRSIDYEKKILGYKTIGFSNILLLGLLSIILLTTGIFFIITFLGLFESSLPLSLIITDIILLTLSIVLIFYVKGLKIRKK